MRCGPPLPHALPPRDARNAAPTNLTSLCNHGNASLFLLYPCTACICDLHKGPFLSSLRAWEPDACPHRNWQPQRPWATATCQLRPGSAAMTAATASRAAAPSSSRAACDGAALVVALEAGLHGALGAGKLCGEPVGGAAGAVVAQQPGLLVQAPRRAVPRILAPPARAFASASRPIGRLALQ